MAAVNIKVPRFQIRNHRKFLRQVKHDIRRSHARIQRLKESGKTDFSFIQVLETFNREMNNARDRVALLCATGLTEKLEALNMKIARLFKELEHVAYTDVELYKQFEKVWRNRKKLNLNEQQIVLIEEIRNIYLDYGIKLAKPKRDRITAIDTQLAMLEDAFDFNIVKFEDAHPLIITDEKDLAGLPESVRSRARFEAKMYGHDGWLFGLEVGEQDLFMKESAFMRYSTNRDLREKLLRAYMSRCQHGRFTNMKKIPKIIRLRDEWSKICGFKNYAEDVSRWYLLKTPKAIMRSMDRLKGPALANAKRDHEELSRFAYETDGILDLKPWDVAFYQEKLRKKRFGFDSQEISAFFPLESVLAGLFHRCKILYGVSFKEKNYSKWHKSVRTFEVIKAGKCRGLLYMDLFPRTGKTSGAWNDYIQNREIHPNGKLTLPICMIGGNFTPPVGDKPSLLTLDDARNLFHETGHALEGLLKDVDYPTIAAPELDRIEIAAIFLEQWPSHKKTLKSMGKHYLTGEPIPDKLVDAIHDSRNHMAGWDLLHHLQKSYLDMALHQVDPKTLTDIHAFERSVRAPLSLLKDEDECLTAHFSHSLAGYYPAGFFSYEYATNVVADISRRFGDNEAENRRLGEIFCETHLAPCPLLVPNGTHRPRRANRKSRRVMIQRNPDKHASVKARGLLKPNDLLKRDWASSQDWRMIPASFPDMFSHQPLGARVHHSPLV